MIHLLAGAILAAAQDGSLLEPVAPDALTAARASLSQIDLAWRDNAVKETGFVIERSADGASFAAAGQATINATTWSDRGLPTGRRFFYRVRAANPLARSEPSNVASAATAYGVPAPPAGLAAATASLSQIDLAWQDASLDEAGFRLERSSDGASYATLASLPAGSVAHADRVLPAGRRFWYRVVAFNDLGTSAPSNVASAVTAFGPPRPPEALAAEPVAETRIALSWRDSSDDETAFRIDRSSDGRAFGTLATVPAGTAAFADGAIAPGQPYWYRVAAVNALGESGSAVAHAWTHRQAQTVGGGTGGEGGAIPLRCVPSSRERGYVDEVVRLLNAHRQANGRAALRVDGNLEGAVEGHCHHMAAHPFFDHYAPEAVVRSPWDRARLCGTSASGENLAAGYATPSDVMNGWRSSAGHNANLLNGRFTRVGAGYFGAGRYWGQLFGY